MSFLLDLILNNRFVLPAIGALLGAAAIYFRGYRAAADAASVKERATQAKIAAEVQKTEAANQTLEIQRSKDVETANSTDSIDQLIGLWNDITGTKGPGGPSSKDKQ